MKAKGSEATDGPEAAAAHQDQEVDIEDGHGGHPRIAARPSPCDFCSSAPSQASQRDAAASRFVFWLMLHVLHDDS